MQAFRRLFAAIGAGSVAATLALCGNAWADSLGLLETSYEVKVKGITMMDVAYRADLSDAGYRSRASIRTRGVAALFSDYLMDVEASGQIVNGQVKPAQYTSRREKKDKTKVIGLTWSGDGFPTGAPQNDKEPDIQAEIDGALAPGAADFLTALLRVGTPGNGGLCQSTERIFDGKEVFDLRFSFKGKVSIDDDAPGDYHGAAYECQMTYVPVAGRYAAKFRKNNEEPPRYRVLLAPVGEDVSGGPLLVPVQASGKLDGYKFLAYASRVKVDGRPFSRLTLK